MKYLLAILFAGLFMVSCTKSSETPAPESAQEETATMTEDSNEDVVKEKKAMEEEEGNEQSDTE